MFMDPKYVVKEFLFQRNSPVARMELGKALLENYNGIYDIEATGLMTNKNVEMLEAHLLQMGTELRFEYDVIDFSEEPGIKTHIYNNRKYVCTTKDMCQIIARDIARLRYEELESGEIYLGKIEDFDDFIEKVAVEIETQVVDYMR